MKVCNLYGAGFYYIPGTDTCIKIGGFVRAEWNHNASGSLAPFRSGSQALYTRNTDTLVARSRAILSMDTRTQTEYGTLRSYFRAGWTNTGQVTPFTATAATNSAGSTIYFDRAFIQFAGFTFGKTQSYFDFFCNGCYTLSTNWLFQETGGEGVNLAAYTAQFGNGVSATLSIEDASLVTARGPVVNTSVTVLGAVTAAAGLGGQTAANHGHEVPDIVGALRVDQAWGSAQISGVAHLNQANYYSNVINQTAHPDDKWGWAVAGGLTLKMPWDPKDTFSVMATYCDGASARCSNGSGTAYGLVNTTTIGVAYWADAFFNGAVPGSQLEQSKTWNIVAAFEHYWTPTLRQSVYGAYNSYEANSASVNAVCGTIANVAAGGFLGAGCSDFSAWTVGSRLLWNPVANLDVGLDVLYTKVDSAFQGAGIGTGGAAGLPPVLLAGDTDTWSGIFRVQRNFWP